MPRSSFEQNAPLSEHEHDAYANPSFHDLRQDRERFEVIQQSLADFERELRQSFLDGSDEYGTRSHRASMDDVHTSVAYLQQDVETVQDQEDRQRLVERLRRLCELYPAYALKYLRQQVLLYGQTQALMLEHPEFAGEVKKRLSTFARDVPEAANEAIDTIKRYASAGKEDLQQEAADLLEDFEHCRREPWWFSFQRDIGAFQEKLEDARLEARLPFSRMDRFSPVAAQETNQGQLFADLRAALRKLQALAARMHDAESKTRAETWTGFLERDVRTCEKQAHHQELAQRIGSYLRVIARLRHGKMDIIPEDVQAWIDELYAHRRELSPEAHRVLQEAQRHGYAPAPVQAENGKLAQAYVTLGVPPEATLADIKHMYRLLAQRYHPDRDPEGKYADRMRDLNLAYEAIQADQKRRSKLG